MESSRLGTPSRRSPCSTSGRWRRTLRKLALACVAGTLPYLVVTQPVSAGEVLTLERALRAAQERSHALAAQDAAAQSAREMAVAAGQLPDPTLRLGIQNLPVSGPDAGSLTRDFMTMRSIGVMQEITRSEKRDARAARFSREADAAQALRLMQLANLQRETAMAWLERHVQERIVLALRMQSGEAALQVEAADAAYRAGRGSQADAFAARSAVAQIEDRIRQAEIQLATATTNLARWVGDEATRPLGTPPSLNTVRLDALSLEARISQHPEILALAARETVAQAEADLARANKRADWSVEIMYSQRGPAFGNMVSIGVAVPLQWDQKNRQERELASRLSMAEQLRAEREELARQIVSQTRRWLQAWRGNLDRVDHYARSLIPLAAERTRAALAAYRGTAGALATVLEARRNEIELRLENLRLEMEIAALWAQLEYLIPEEHAAGAVGLR